MTGSHPTESRDGSIAANFREARRQQADGAADADKTPRGLPPDHVAASGKDRRKEISGQLRTGNSPGSYTPHAATTQPTCDYCGWLGWTVEKYGRVTHKQGCPHRVDPWHQGDPHPEERPAAYRQRRLRRRMLNPVFAFHYLLTRWRLR